VNEIPVNLVLLSRSEIGKPLPLNDRRARHILDVLNRNIGESFDAGIINGERGKASIVAIDSTAIHLSFIATHEPIPADPIVAIIGLPRPQTARDMLRDATTLGVAALNFVTTEKSDPNYARSTLWSSGEWKRHVLAGVEQAFDTAVPEVRVGGSLAAALAALPENSVTVALDNYEGTAPLAAGLSRDYRRTIVVAIGPERGWSGAERDLFRKHGFQLLHLGTRVLRAETALVAALAVIKSVRGSV
jgi:16S rRNA (uracil1498-N3)-methyltransferase